MKLAANQRVAGDLALRPSDPLGRGYGHNKAWPMYFQQLGAASTHCYNTVLVINSTWAGVLS